MGGGRRSAQAASTITWQVPQLAEPPQSAVEATLPGTVLVAAGGRIVVACGADGAVEILRLVPEGSRSMTAADYLRGSPLRAGMRLG